MFTDIQIKAWLDYMTDQKILQHFKPIHEVSKDNIQYWGKLRFPVLGCTYGTYNHPKIKILSIFEFIEGGYFEKWVEIKKNPYLKFNSNCKILKYESL